MKLIFCVFFSVTLSLDSWPAAAEVARRDEERGQERGCCISGLAWCRAGVPSSTGVLVACSCSAAGGYTMQRGCGVDYRCEFVKLIFMMGFWGEELQLAWVLA